MVKYRRTRKNRKARKTRRRMRGGYAPIGPNGGNEGYKITTYPVGQTGELPDPMAAAGVPIGAYLY